MTDRYIRMPELLVITALAKSTIYFKIGNGTFPPQVKISERASAWRESDVNIWKQDPTSYTSEGV